jgi:putative alpha-1,2-mannosidase
VKLNGIQLTDPFIHHADIINGGVLEFEMSAKPNKKGW